MVNEYLGKDIMLKDGDIQFSNSQDFALRTNDENLRQAVSNRLNTVLGEYENVFYGSQVSRVFGLPKTDLTKSELKGYIFESLLQEPRIDSIERLNITFGKNVNEIEVDLLIKPIDSNISLNLIFPLFLQLGE